MNDWHGQSLADSCRLVPIQPSGALLYIHFSAPTIYARINYPLLTNTTTACVELLPICTYGPVSTSEDLTEGSQHTTKVGNSSVNTEIFVTLILL